MTTEAAPAKRRYAAWLSPFRVAPAGTIMVVLLLTLPIYTLGPGDHEKKSCGNALVLDLGPWQGSPTEDYWEKAYRACTGQRVDRLAQAVGVVSVTVLIVTMMSTRTRRRDSPDGGFIGRGRGVGSSDPKPVNR